MFCWMEGQIFPYLRCGQPLGLMFCSMEESILLLFTVWAASWLDAAQRRRSDLVAIYGVGGLLAWCSTVCKSFAVEAPRAPESPREPQRAPDSPQRVPRTSESPREFPELQRVPKVGDASCCAVSNSRFNRYLRCGRPLGLMLRSVEEQI
jgi:hypothetical protein